MRGSTTGFPNALTTKHSAPYYAFLSVLDVLFASLIVAPLVVGYWRAVWELMNLYVYPGDHLSSALVSVVIGLFGHLLFMVPQHTFGKALHPERNRILFYVTSRIYTFCFSFVCVNGWRGLWEILDLYTEDKVLTVAAPTTVAIIILGAMKALRNISSSPFLVSIDSSKDYFEVLTMFKVPMKEKKTLYILDCLFSVTVIGYLVVFVWRGSWALLDILLFPESKAWSSWGSLILGYLVVAITFMLQPFMKWLCGRITGVARLLAADAFLLLSFFGTVNVWRGIWHLLNFYFLPDDVILSCWLTHWFCIIILILIGCANSILVRGVYIDAEEPGGNCVVFPCYYLRVIFQELKLKKLKKQQGKGVIANGKPFQNNHVVNIPNISEHCEKKY